MSGFRSGIAKKILEEESTAVFTYCYGHALNLACSDAVKGCKLTKNALDTAYEIIKLVKESTRREAMLQILSNTYRKTTGIRVLCPARWSVRAQALQSIIANYNILQKPWHEALDIVKDTEMKSRIQGVSICMKLFEFFFGLVLKEFILKHSDNLCKTLQTRQMSAAEGQKIAEMTVCTLQSVWSYENFELFWTKVTAMASNSEVDAPVLPRQWKRHRK